MNQEWFWGAISTRCLNTLAGKIFGFANIKTLRLNGNYGVNGGGVYDGVLYNSIVYFNTLANYSSSTMFTNSCTTPEKAGCASGNITNDPMFVANGSGYGTNFVAGNYHLQRGSPCINAGINQSWMPGARDLDGHSRIDRFSGVVDMGCYEYLPQGTFYSVP